MLSFEGNFEHLVSWNNICGYGIFIQMVIIQSLSHGGLSFVGYYHFGSKIPRDFRGTPMSKTYKKYKNIKIIKKRNMSKMKTRRPTRHDATDATDATTILTILQMGSLNMPAGGKFLEYVVQGFPYYARRGQNFGICCKRVPLICPQGPIFCKRVPLICPLGPTFLIFVVKGLP